MCDEHSSDDCSKPPPESNLAKPPDDIFALRRAALEGRERINQSRFALAIMYGDPIVYPDGD